MGSKPSLTAVVVEKDDTGKAKVVTDMVQRNEKWEVPSIKGPSVLQTLLDPVHLSRALKEPKVRLSLALPDHPKYYAVCRMQPSPDNVRTPPVPGESFHHVVYRFLKKPDRFDRCRDTDVFEEAALEDESEEVHHLEFTVAFCHRKDGGKCENVKPPVWINHHPRGFDDDPLSPNVRIIRIVVLREMESTLLYLNQRPASLAQRLREQMPVLQPGREADHCHILDDLVVALQILSAQGDRQFEPFTGSRGTAAPPAYPRPKALRYLFHCRVWPYFLEICKLLAAGDRPAALRLLGDAVRTLHEWTKFEPHLQHMEWKPVDYHDFSEEYKPKDHREQASAARRLVVLIASHMGLSVDPEMRQRPAFCSQADWDSWLDRNPEREDPNMYKAQCVPGML